VALDDAREALAERDAGHVDFLPDWKMSRRRAAGLQLAACRGDAEFAQHAAGFDAGLGEVAGSGFVDAVRAALAERDLNGAVAVVLAVLIWVTRLFDTSTTVTGTESPSSVNTRVMPTLRPTSPKLIFVPFRVYRPFKPGADCNWSALLTTVTSDG
jgi:hypothetical protein